jgi:hypothetical protein
MLCGVCIGQKVTISSMPNVFSSSNMPCGSGQPAHEREEGGRKQDERMRR